MAGEAKTNAFLLQTATLMIGAKDDLFNLNDAAHSVGLVKNTKMGSDPAYIELTQGVKNNVVDSVMTSNKSSVSLEVYEYTAKNLMYSLGLDGSTLTSTGLDYAPTTNIAAAATTAVIGSDVSTTFGIGDWIEIRQGNDSHIAKLSAVAYSAPDTTLTFAGYAIPTGVTFVAANTKVRKVVQIDVGSTVDQPYLSAKLAFAKLSDGYEITVLFPKIRISKGFNLSSQTDNYSNMPFEFTPYQMTPADTNYSKFPSVANFYIFRKVLTTG